MMTSKKRIVLLHATPIAIGPIQRAFKEFWPQAETVNLMDDGLTIDRAREDALSERIIERFVSLGTYGYNIGADAILVTCSAFGPAIDRLAEALPVPVLKPNEAMFRSAISNGTNIGMLATFGPSVSTMSDEFEQFSDEAGSAARLETILVEEAIDLLRAGDVAEHNRLVAARAPELTGCDAIMLAHFSTSEAAAAVSDAVKVPVLSAPRAAVEMLRDLL